jgi:hypothetical protein
MKEKLLISLSSQKIARFLFFIVIGFSIVNFIAQYIRYFLPNYPFIVRLLSPFDVDKETSIPTLYSVITLFFCAILLIAIAEMTKLTQKSYVRDWQALSLVFLFLAFDEYLSLHERLIQPLRVALKANSFFHFTWVIPGAIFTIVCFSLFLRLLFFLPAYTRRLFLIAGIVYLTGALGMEVIGGYSIYLYGEDNFLYRIIIIIEEFLEMLGIIIFIHTLLFHLSSNLKVVKIHINGKF